MPSSLIPRPPPRFASLGVVPAENEARTVVVSTREVFSSWIVMDKDEPHCPRASLDRFSTLIIHSKEEPIELLLMKTPKMIPNFSLT